MLNFTIGPVMSNKDVLSVSAESSPYFRTREFSEIMLENERMMLDFLAAPENSRCVFLTASGTGAMESCVMNILNETDKVIVINGGTFGQRFVELCQIHQVNFTEVRCEYGKQVKKCELDLLNDKGYTALLVNMNETSSGLLYNMELISDFCNKNHILLIVDGISAFISDEINMEKIGAAAIITGSQKALAVQPGVSIIALTPQAINRIESNKEKCMYLSLKQALTNMERGQTPFTPAVTILLQINIRLKRILQNGGIEAERNKIIDLVNYFRKQIIAYPFEMFVEDKSNAVTALRTNSVSADDVVRILKDDYQIWVCPNGGEYKDKVFRVGHIGDLSKFKYDMLFSALDDMKKRKLI